MDEQKQADFSYDPDDQEDLLNAQAGPEDQQNPTDKQRAVSWTGSEFIANHKDHRWFMGFFVVLVLVVAAVFVFTKDYISTVSIALVGILFAVLANHKPRQLTYQVDNSGINIGSKFYPFEQFKSFSLARDGAIGYINLLPLKRFMPDVSIYFPPEETEKILAILSDHLPHNEDDERQIDKLAKKFRF